MQEDAGRCRGDARGCRGLQTLHPLASPCIPLAPCIAGGAKPAPAKSAAAKPAASKADYSRPRQTVADQSILISAVLQASWMPLFGSLLHVDAGRYQVVVFQDINPHTNQEEQACKPGSFARFADICKVDSVESY